MEALVFDQEKQEMRGVRTYAGVAIWERVAAHFGPRLSEWSNSCHMLLWGYVLLIPNSHVFSNPSFKYFAEIFGNQVFLGVVLFTFGFFGLIGLTVNGMRKEVTPWMRFARAAVGFWCFLGMSTCFALSGNISTWIAIYPVLTVVELVNMFRTSADAGEANGIKL